MRLKEGNFADALTRLDIEKEVDALLSSGAKRIHVVDLEGSLGKPNLRIIRSLSHYVSSHALIQVGGGLRSLRLIGSYLDAGASHVILGTIAFTNPQFLLGACSEFPNQIGIGLDDRSGVVVTNAWKQESGSKTSHYLGLVRNFGPNQMAYTSIRTDGRLLGLNWFGATAVTASTATPLLISGGLSSSEEWKVSVKGDDWLVGMLCGSAVFKKLIGASTTIGMADFPF